MPDFLSSITSGGVTVFSFILILGLLVFVHELGHFVVAKRAGIRVEEFGFGYPPRMFTLFKRDETIYTINWLPLGGFVRMVGENGEEANDPHSFASKSKLARAAVLVAGSAMNLLLPIIIFTVIAMTGVPDGEPTGRVQVMGVEPNSPAQEAGLQAGDEVLYVASQRIMSVGQLQQLVQQFEGREVTVDVEREGEMLSFTMTPRRLGEQPQVMIGVSIIDERAMVRYNPIRALSLGIQQTVTLFGLMLQGFADLIGGLFTGGVEANSLAGPVGIMQATGEVARTGSISNLLNFAAFLSINLAIINLMPFPALDGGRLLFIIVEALRGKRISPEREGLVHLLGMLLLLALMAFISVIDIQRLLGGGSVLQ
ncbi:MAG TPA: RIP metalloprotease RseP [Ardenticatenaceae bacterium]|jgi:regulator of sigma E protease